MKLYANKYYFFLSVQKTLSQVIRSKSTSDYCKTENFTTQVQSHNLFKLLTQLNSRLNIEGWISWALVSFYTDRLI